MTNKSVQSKLHVRVRESKTKTASPEEIRRRLKELVLLLYEIDQQNKVSKGHKDVSEN